MPKTEVWVSGAPVDPTLIKGFDTDVALADQKLAVDALRKSAAGVPLPAERFPKEFYGEYYDKSYKKQPDIFMAGGFWCVSKACADVLNQHDLGETKLYPAKFFQHDRKRPVEGEYFCLALGEQKQAFLPEESPNCRKPHETVDIWKLPLGKVNDNDCAVSEAALGGAVLWADPLVRHAFFLSDELVQSLKAAKLTRRWGLRRCRIIA